MEKLLSKKNYICKCRAGLKKYCKLMVGLIVFAKKRVQYLAEV